MRHYYTLHLFFKLPDDTVGVFCEFDCARLHLDECVDRVCVAFSRRNCNPFPIIGVQVYKQYFPQGRVYPGFINMGANAFNKVLYLDDLTK